MLSSSRSLSAAFDELCDVEESLVAACKGRLDWQADYGSRWTVEQLQETHDFVQGCSERIAELRRILGREW